MPGRVVRGNWQPAELQLLKTLVEEGYTDEQVMELMAAQGFKRTRKAVQLKREREGLRMQVQPGGFSIEAPVVVQAERALALFDIHAPNHKASWLNRVIALAARWGVRLVIVGGDVVEYSSISYWGRTVGIELQQEIDSVCHVVQVLERNFEQRVLLGGNHDMRLAKALNSALTLGQVMAGFTNDANTITCNRKWCILESGGLRIRITHPKNYNRIPSRNSQRLAAVYRSHVIAGHNHVWGQAFDESGTFWAIDAGCCLDKRHTSWLEYEMSNNPQPILGACIVVDGVPILLGEDNIAFYEGIKL